MSRTLLALLLLALPFGACTCENENVNDLRPPTISTVSDAIEFGDVPVNIQATRVVILHNTGELELAISQVRVSGSDDFSVVDAPTSVAAGGSGTLRVAFTPSMVGPAMGAIVLVNNSENGEKRITLSGNGVDGAVCGPCDMPPAPTCVSPTESLAYDPVGVCDDGQCRYLPRRVPCSDMCTMGACTGTADAGTAVTTDAGMVTTTDAGMMTTDAGMVTTDAGMGGISTNCTQLGTDIRVTNDSASSAWPDLAWNGSGLGLSWQSSASSNPSDGINVGFAVVDGSGAPTVMPVMLSPSQRVAQQPSIAWTGSSYGIVWSDIRDGNNELYFSMESPAGMPVGAAETRLTTEMNLQFGVRAVWNPEAGEFGLAWMDSRDVGMNPATEIYFGRVSAAGVLLGSPTRVTTRPGTWKDYPAIAWSGSQYAIAWPETDSSGGGALPSVRLARVDGQGTVLGTELVVAESMGGMGWPTLAWSGSFFGIAWMDARNGSPDLFMARVTTDGTRMGADTPITSDPHNSLFPSMAYGNGQFGLVWQDDRDGGAQIWFAAIHDDGSIAVPERRITCTAFPASLPDVTWTGSDWAVGWADQRFGNYEVFVKRLSL